MKCGWCFPLLAGLCILVLGCGTPKPTPVQGFVTLDGEPLSYARVSLHLSDGRTAETAADREGRFRFRDVRDIAGKEFVVTVSCLQLKGGEPVPDDIKPSEVDAIEMAPEMYRSPEHSPLKFALTQDEPDLALHLNSM